MAMSPEIAQLRISRDLEEAEQALDTAILKQSSLMTTMIVARRDTGQNPFTGQATLMRLAKSTQTLVTAGGELARVHGGLLEIGRERGVIERCPPNEPMRGEAKKVA